VSNDIPIDDPQTALQVMVRELRKDLKEGILRIETKLEDHAKADAAQWGVIRGIEAKLNQIPLERANAMIEMEAKCVARDEKLEGRVRDLEQKAASTRVIIAIIGAVAMVLGGGIGSLFMSALGG